MLKLVARLYLGYSVIWFKSSSLFTRNLLLEILIRLYIIYINTLCDINCIQYFILKERLV
jgi:hypothetical protein